MTMSDAAMPTPSGFRANTGLPEKKNPVIILEQSFYNSSIRVYSRNGPSNLHMPPQIVANARRASRDQHWSSMMAAAQQGDGQAYGALLEECVPHIRKIAFAIGVADDRVDDVVQETLITIHRARHTFDPRRSFAAWLNVIGRRRAIDELRNRHRCQAKEVFEPAAYEGYIDEADGPDETRYAEEVGRQLRTAMKRLTPGQREAVEALGLREQSLEKAAIETGKTKGALKVNFHRALKALRGRLRQDV